MDGEKTFTSLKNEKVILLFGLMIHFSNPCVSVFQYALKLLYVAVFVGLSAFVGM